MARYDCEIETKEKMFKAKDKIEQHTNITEMLAVILYRYLPALNSESRSPANYV